MIAEVTWFYRWGPRDVAALTWTEVTWWNAQALRIKGVGDGQ